MTFRKIRKTICKKRSVQKTILARKEPSLGVMCCFTIRIDDQNTQINKTIKPNTP